MASRLAKSASKPSVLLLEAGDAGLTDADRDVSQRFQLAFKQNSKLNWRYKTTEQFGRRIDYSSGRVLGGSTAINFCAFIVGSKEDYNEWAKIVDDEAFGWDHVKETLERVGRYHLDIDPEYQDYVKVPERSGNGALDLTFGEAKSHTIHDNFAAADQVGWTRNLDLNSGDPIGMGISPQCFLEGKRMTAANAYLDEDLENLVVVTNTTIARIVAEERMAVGIDGQIYKARKEIVVCCGAVKTPQLLMLSGIGDPEELERHSIQPTHELRRVGKGLQDHCYSSAGIVLSNNDLEPDPELLPGQRIPSLKGWFKLPTLLSSPEFSNLSPSTQFYLQNPTVPNWEIAIAPPLRLKPNEITTSAIAIITNPQSRGTVTLRSNNPLDSPLIDPNFLSHPFDRKAITEAMREMLRYFQAPIFASRTVERVSWPKDDSDAAIFEQTKRNLASSWHPCGTVAMGLDAKTACVDNNFKIFGVDGLRVVDMSICPLLPCNHTQSTAYLIGEIAAEKMIAEYGLDLAV